MQPDAQALVRITLTSLSNYEKFIFQKLEKIKKEFQPNFKKYLIFLFQQIKIKKNNAIGQ